MIGSNSKHYYKAHRSLMRHLLDAFVDMQQIIPKPNLAIMVHLSCSMVAAAHVNNKGCF